ncbi:hypothetical protein KM043_013135 [Ampulex compressa]|nr:hypothetical protein KM043_013135 [Ampulex compressa]
MSKEEIPARALPRNRPHDITYNLPKRTANGCGLLPPSAALSQPRKGGKKSEGWKKKGKASRECLQGRVTAVRVLGLSAIPIEKHESAGVCWRG